MDFSREQEDIFQFAEKGVKNLIVQAVAGAGKTTTLVECARRIGEGKKILLLAHNKSTKETLISRVGNMKNVKIYTLHGLGWRLLQEHFNVSPVIDDEKYRNYMKDNLKGYLGKEFHALSGPYKMIYRANLTEILSKARQNLKQSEKEISKLMKKKYGMTLVADEARVGAEILKWGETHLETVDFLDLLWLPYQYNFYTKKYLADIIMLDEAQDVSLAQQDLIKRCFQRTTRLFAFGDKDQLINSWAGSDAESFEHLKSEDEFRRPAVELPLTTNYRCGKRIIDFAKQYTESNIHATENAEDGEINFDVSLSEAKDGDMVLCRNAAPLMKAYKKGIAQGKKMYFRGDDVANDIKNAVDTVDGETVEEIIKNLKRRLIATWERAAIDADVDKKEVVDDIRVVKQLDILNAFEAFPRTVKTRDDIYMFIDAVFSDEDKEGIQLSTIHKAKGLEADNVYVICPSLIPSKLAKLNWQKEEEVHLQYVMCTRPKHSLNFVSENEIRPNLAFLGQRQLYNELYAISVEVEKIREEDICSAKTGV